MAVPQLQQQWRGCRSERKDWALIPQTKLGGKSEVSVRGQLEQAHINTVRWMKKLQQTWRTAGLELWRFPALGACFQIRHLYWPDCITDMTDTSRNERAEMGVRPITVMKSFRIQWSSGMSAWIRRTWRNTEHRVKRNPERSLSLHTDALYHITFIQLTDLSEATYHYNTSAFARVEATQKLQESKSPTTLNTLICLGEERGCRVLLFKWVKVQSEQTSWS